MNFNTWMHYHAQGTRPSAQQAGAVRQHHAGYARRKAQQRWHNARRNTGHLQCVGRRAVARARQR
ncbi:hypothetical protein HAX54_044735, partial [Datura stramonium]|nr:hypothetical protein [Datura stramonium]